MTIRRAAIYIRTACDDQHEVELACQEQLLRKWAEHRGDTVIRVYADIGPGLIEPRPGLGQLLTDAEAGLFDVLLLHDPTRLFRLCLLCSLCYDRLHHELGLEVAFYCPQCPTPGGAS
jgi:DNA invertase Pin-like site-specific DNA recombinase